jgi:segregation and condensation protein B
MPELKDALAAEESYPSELADRPAAAPPDVKAAVEALLFSSPNALPPRRIAELVNLPAAGVADEIVDALNREYEATGRSFRAEQVAGGWQLFTQPTHRDLIADLDRRAADARLTPAARETLAIIAYRQPVLRAEVEAVRGVAAGEAIRSLIDRRLVKIASRRTDLPGRPIVYGTTRRFLELFGLHSLDDLPRPVAERPRDPAEQLDAAS